MLSPRVARVDLQGQMHAILHTTMQVLYGLDYTVSEQEQQHDLLRASILQHLRYNPETLLVIEEYDNEIDCPTRGLLKQLIDSPQSTNTSYGRYALLLHPQTPYFC